MNSSPTNAPAERHRPDFRTDINGLRAYAVIAVLLYHFKVAGVTGGYAGVDVFFVISGFLMTAIILPAVESGRFSLSAFYLARVRRIYPALVVLCLVLLLFGWFWLAPYLYEDVGKGAGSSLLFFSNHAFNRPIGYFAEPAHNNWFLHTWSVSVEWQFYLLYPLFLLALVKWLPGGRRATAIAIGALLIASFAASVYMTAHKPTSAFFLLPSRAWELLAGSLVFLYGTSTMPSAVRRAFEITGFALIGFILFYADSNTTWPGALALVPVLGASLILLAAREQSLLTGNALAQVLGRWSYSIYLWHWPLVVGLGYFGVKNETPWVAAMLAASIALGAASYRWIEQPSARWMRAHTPRWNWSLTATAFVVVFSFAAVAYFGKGVAHPLRLPDDVLAANNGKLDIGRRSSCNHADSNCVLGSGSTNVFVWGDSHAIAAVDAVAESSLAANGSVRFLAQMSCPVLFDARSDSLKDPNFCCRFNSMAFAELQKQSAQTPVLIIHRTDLFIGPGRKWLYFDDNAHEQGGDQFEHYRRHQVESLCRIAARNPVYVMLPIPVMPVDVPAELARVLIQTGKEPVIQVARDEFEQSRQPVVDVLREAAEQCGVRLLDPLPYLCSETVCPGVVAGRPLYSDDNHLTLTGARRLMPLFDAISKPVRP
jgi:peptidoglycan/LPS O-acetylase OafA/YrhL